MEKKKENGNTTIVKMESCGKLGIIKMERKKKNGNTIITMEN